MGKRSRHLSLSTFVEVWVGLRRVTNLLTLYDHAVVTTPRKRDTPPSDILRAAVVLLHAVLEEFVRYVANRRLPSTHAELLDEVPIPATPRSLVKFGLGAVAHHRGKTVEELLKVSVAQYLEKKSFSSLAEILRVLSACGVPSGTLRIPHTQLQRMIERRHQIVHEADRVRVRKVWSDAPRALSRRQVVQWHRAVERFIRAVDGQLQERHG